jgi:hypothetical protein
VTVIRNLPQLQKLDNVIVQPDDMADAMRRGVEMVHPLEREPSPPPQAMYHQKQQMPFQVRLDTNSTVAFIHMSKYWSSKNVSLF